MTPTQAARTIATVAEQGGAGLHPCTSCGLELDSDDRNERCDECTAVPCPVCGGSMRFCECMDDPFAAVPSECQHDWLDRPESDTHECLMCGEERSG